MTLLKFSVVGFSSMTSTLLICGGRRNAMEVITNQCYFYDLNSDHPTNVWNSSASLNMPRLDASLVTVRDEMYIFAGTDPGNNAVLEMELFNSSRKTVEKVTDAQGNWLKLANTEFAFGRTSCVNPIEEMNSFVVSGAQVYYDLSRRSWYYTGSTALFHLDTKTWEALPSMPIGRANHGCETTTVKNQLRLVIFGGSKLNTILSSIYIYNFATKQWAEGPAPMALPGPIGGIKVSKIIKMDEDGCDMMFFAKFNLSICTGNYQWTVISPAQIDDGRNAVLIGANELLPCGV